MKNQRPVVIAYDIHNNRSRGRVLKIIKAWRLEGQRSVHECRLSMDQAQELFIQLAEHLDQDTDRLMFAWIAPNRSILYRGLAKDRITSDVWHIG